MINSYNNFAEAKLREVIKFKIYISDYKEKYNLLSN